MSSAMRASLSFREWVVLTSGWYCFASLRNAALMSSLLALVRSCRTAYGDLGLLPYVPIEDADDDEKWACLYPFD